MHDEWKFDYQGRIFATPVLNPCHPGAGYQGARLGVGARGEGGAHRPAPAPGFRGSRSFGYPEFDPFWQAVVDADILVSMHSSDSGYARYTSDWTGPSEMLPFKLDSFKYMTGGHRPIQDTMAAFVCHRVFARFPDLRVASIEAGGEWIRAFVDHLGDTYKKMPNAFDGNPVEQFKHNVYVSPTTRTTSGRSSTSSVPTTSCSGPTTRTPRAWPSRPATSTTCRRVSPMRTCGRSWAGTWPGSCGSSRLPQRSDPGRPEAPFQPARQAGFRRLHRNVLHSRVTF